MKTRLLTLLFLLSGTGVLSAQQRIEQLVTRAEQASNVDTNVVINRNRESGATERTVKTVTINDNRALVSEFRTAFDRERDNAYQITENTSDGVSNRRLRFRSGEREISCTLRIESDSKATVSYTDRDANVPAIQFFFNGRSVGTMSVDTVVLRRRLEELKPQLEELSRNMEYLGTEYGPRLEELGRRIEGIGRLTEIQINGQVVTPGNEPQ